MKPEGLDDLKKKQKLRSQIVWTTLTIVFAYITISAGETLWQNYQINHEIDKLKKEIIALQEQGQNLRHLIAYRGTESFKEREARRKLGYKKPGEQVLAVLNPMFNEVESGQAKDITEDSPKANHTNPEKWFEYILS